jgi:hypothetical protein
MLPPPPAPFSISIFCSTRTTKSYFLDTEYIQVMHHHQHGKLRLLTVSDLKSFLGARKAKVGGTKEVLVQRVTELLG